MTIIYKCIGKQLDLDLSYFSSEKGVPRSRMDQRARRTVRIGTLGSRAKRMVRTNDLEPRAVSLCANIVRMLVTNVKSLK
jgi:hypothetical protein